jgi:ATP-dependent DNA ligase
MAENVRATMEARQVETLPSGPGWQFEPKWDGFRCLAGRRGDRIELLGRSGKSLARYFPEMVEALKAVRPRRFVLDGELVIPVGAELSFEALQMRLHPADSRVRRLASETPALLIVFDLLEGDGGRDLRASPLSHRRAELERFFRGLGEHPSFRLSPATTRRSEAATWLKRAGRGELDGVMAKKLDQPYLTGERAMLKIKNLRTADCVVGGFRYAAGSKQVGSLLLGLFNEAGLLDHVGFTSGLATLDRVALTHRLEKLKGGGFTGDAPGGPSRWSTERTSQWVPVKPRLVAEVQYDHVTGHRFRHGTGFVRWRPDKAPSDCGFDQLVRETRPSRLTHALTGARAPTGKRRARKAA